jgi:hypothetical protein
MRIYLLFFVICLFSMGRAQVAESSDSITNKIESGNADAIQDWMQMSCVGSYRATSAVMTLDVHEDRLVVVVTSVGCDQFAIILFRNSSDSTGRWTYDQTIQLSSPYGAVPKVVYPQFVERGIHEIFISGIITDSGSGVLQRDCIVLKLIHERLLTVFDDSEFVSFSEKERNIIQRSTFTVHDSVDANIAGNQFLKEERRVTTNGHRSVRVRNCYWDSRIKHFMCVEGSMIHKDTVPRHIVGPNARRQQPSVP